MLDDKKKTPNTNNPLKPYAFPMKRPITTSITAPDELKFFVFHPPMEMARIKRIRKKDSTVTMYPSLFRENSGS
ncbi:hypothetical protein R0J90_21350, partial [Micrococcus sp. SIMBA_144]